MSLEDSRIEHILGHADPERKWEFAIILQGPRFKSSTAEAVRIFLENNDPETVLLIVSTYLSSAERLGDEPAGSSLSQFERDIVMENKGPHSGRLVYLFLKPVDKDEFPDFYRTNYWNQNNQRLSTFMGLRFADSLGIEYVLKCRSDSFLAAPNVCKLLKERYSDKYPPHSEAKMHSRLVVNDHATRRLQNCKFLLPIFRWDKIMGPYFICDRWLFGYISDVMTYWDMRVGSKWDGGRGIRIDSSVETNATRVWMAELAIPDPIPEDITPLLSRYFIVASCLDTQFVFGKYESDFKEFRTCKERYFQRLQREDPGISFTHHRWLKLLENMTPQSIGK